MRAKKRNAKEERVEAAAALSDDLLSAVTPEALQAATKALLSHIAASNTSLGATQESRQVFSELCLPRTTTLSPTFSASRSTVGSGEDLHKSVDGQGAERKIAAEMKAKSRKKNSKLAVPTSLVS